MNARTFSTAAALAILFAAGSAKADGVRDAAAKIMGDYGDRPQAITYYAPVYQAPTQPMASTDRAPVVAPPPVAAPTQPAPPNSAAPAPSTRQSFSFEPSTAFAPAATSGYRPMMTRGARNMWNPSATTKMLGNY